MGFYKDCENLMFFLSVHVIFFMQILLVYFIEDKESPNLNIVLLIHKIIFYIILFLTFYSHLQISVTDPGSIKYYNNLDILEFYYFIYRDINSIVEKSENAKLNNKTNDYDEDDNDNYYNKKKHKRYNNYSDEDKYDFELKTSINSKLKRQLSKKFKIKTSRCYNCLAVRPKDSHHCSTCHCCILEQDHHCPWINNCVGLFNKKYFIIFNMYALLSVIYSSLIYYYYTAFKNYRSFRNDITKSLIAVFWGLFAFIYGLFVAIMVIEQRDNVLKEFKKYKVDKEDKKILLKLKMRIIFGGEFSIKWFLPFYEGGKRQILYFIRKKKYEMYQEKSKKENKNKIENKIDNKIENKKEE